MLEVHKLQAKYVAGLEAAVAEAVDTGNLAHPELGLGQDGLRRTLDLVFEGLAAPRTATQESAR